MPSTVRTSLLAALIAALAACAGRAAPGTRPLPPDARASAETGPLLACAAEVAEEVGLAVIDRRADRGELRASRADPRGGPGGRLDVVTVRIGTKVSQGLRVLAESFRRRAGTSAGAGAAWEAERPSLQAALARDAILQRCGTLEDGPRR